MNWFFSSGIVEIVNQITTQHNIIQSQLITIKIKTMLTLFKLIKLTVKTKLLQD